MEKTFKTISIGDTIYQLCDTYELGNPEKTQVHSILVTSLSIDKDNGNLLINKITTYNGSSYWSIIVKAEKLNRTYYRFEPEQNTHRKGFFFLNAEDANYIVKRAVIKKINTLEKSIPTYIAKCKKDVEGLRSVFHEILNPSYYPEYRVLKETV